MPRKKNKSSSRPLKKTSFLEKSQVGISLTSQAVANLNKIVEETGLSKSKVVESLVTGDLAIASQAAEQTIAIAPEESDDDSNQVVADKIELVEGMATEAESPTSSSAKTESGVLAELKAKIQEHKNSFKALKNHSQEQEALVKQLEQQLAEKDDHDAKGNNDAQAEITELKQQLSQQTADGKAELEKLEQQLTTQQANDSSLQQQLTEKESALTQLQQELEQAKSATEQANGDREKVQSQLTEKESALTQLQQQLSDQQTEIEQANGDREKVQQQLTEKESALTQLQQQLSDQQTEIEQANGDREKVQSQLTEKESALTQLEQELDQALKCNRASQRRSRKSAESVNRERISLNSATAGVRAS